MDNTGLKKLITTYENLTYFDQYGGSLVILVIASIIVALIIAFCISKVNSQMIIDDWPNQRCKLSVIPFAGFITHPEGVSATEYTQENFNYCTQQVLASITGPAIEPMVFVTGLLNSIANLINNSIQSIRAVIFRIRDAIIKLVRNIISRLVNIMIPLHSKDHINMIYIEKNV
jgi:uncharacterized membrane protein YraQ (UPF0718 family)